ncbi:MAG: MarR family winged helix-turn-helix transcriptional regulator [Oscillospiraceae bacterium]
MDIDNVSDKVGPKIKIIANSFRRSADSVTAELGITGAQSFLLGYLSRSRESLPCQHDIEVRFNIKHPTATGLLRRLEEKGFVEFKPDKFDRRLKRIAITPAGLEASELTKTGLDSAEAQITKNFTEEELKELHRLLDKLVCNARALRREVSQEGEDDKC